MGVVVVSCFMTNEDLVDPYALYVEPQTNWSSDGKLMFGLSSILLPSDPLRQFLVDRGWVMKDGAKIFVQVNHSALLDDLLDALLALAKDLERPEPPRGE
jgi:hypothetical protein